MEDIDEELKINIHSILPSISEETVNGIIHAVKYVGVETMSDLQFVQEEDLILVLKPIQRRKLVKAWSEQNIPPVKLSNLPPKNDTSNTQIDEINKKIGTYVPPFSRNGESRQSVSTMPSETENTTNSEIDEINKKIGKYVPPHVRSEERRQNVSTMSSETESIPPVKSSNLSLEKCNWDHNKCLVLLQVYPKYKTELRYSNAEEKNEVWKKIAEEVHQRCSLKCNELHCKDKIKKLKTQYYILKQNPEKVLGEKMAVLFNEAKNAFENNSVVSPVTASNSLSVNCKSDFKKNIRLLRRYTKHKPELSHPDVEEWTVWQKIAPKCEESECRNKLDELRCEYERIKNENVTDRSTAMFLDEAKKAFDTTETTEQSAGKALSIKRSNNDFLSKLLRVYTIYKTELASPDTEEQNVWEKIARKMRETFSYNCGERICCFEVCQLKCQYEDFKRGKLKNGNTPFSFEEEAREAFEDSAKLDRTIKVSNLSENVEKSDLQELFVHFGRIAHIYDIKNSPDSKGFALIKFHKEEDATRAIKIVNGHEYDKLILKVEWAEHS